MRIISKPQGGFIFTGTAAIVFLIVITMIGVFSGEWGFVIGTWALSAFLTILNIIGTSISDSVQRKKTIRSNQKLKDSYLPTQEDSHNSDLEKQDKLKNEKREIKSQSNLSPAKNNNYLSDLEQLSKLKDKEITTEEDYDRKKDEILFGGKNKRKKKPILGLKISYEEDGETKSKTL